MSFKNTRYVMKAVTCHGYEILKLNVIVQVNGSYYLRRVNKMKRMNCIKCVTSMQKLIYIFIIMTTCSLLLTACMSREERAKAANNEALAKPIVQGYLKMNYGGGKVKSLECLNLSRSSGVIPDFRDYASSYVKSSVIVNNQKFSVITNVETGQCYDNYNEQLIMKALKDYAVSSLSIVMPHNIEVHYSLKGLYGIRYNDYAGFAEFGVKTADDLFEKDGYQIYVVCKYIASDMDFESVDVKNFFPASDVSDVYLAIVNFRSYERYTDDDMVYFENFYFYGASHYYSLSDVVTAYKEKNFYPESGKYVYDDNIYYDYAHYLSKTINGIEFSWNDLLYTLDFEEIPAEKEVQTEYYSGATFYATNEKDVSISCTSRLDDTQKSSIQIYCYFDKALSGRQVLVVESVDNSKKYNVFTLEWKTNDCLYRYLNVYKPKASFTIGFYERR